MGDHKVQRSSGRFPITALEVWDVSNEEKYFIWGSGPYVSVRAASADNSEHIYAVSMNDSVHNIRIFKHAGIVVAFGGKSLSVLTFQDGSFSVSVLLDQLDDLVLDFALPFASQWSVDAICYVGYAHNFVDIASIGGPDGYVCKARIQCPDISVLFHMAFAPDCTSNSLTIASGTVFGKIILWKVDSTAKSSLVHFKASEHEGVIFRIKWSADMTKLVSVADDRTVRMWNICYDPSDTTKITHLELVYTAWGHISRVWDVVFLGDGSDAEVASCSEDGTVKLWNRDGVCTTTMRGHSHHVWRLATACGGQILVSGGNDASIKLWDVPQQRRLSPQEPGSTAQCAAIPMWPLPPPHAPALAPASAEVDTSSAALSESVEEGNEELPLPAKKKKGSVASRRANGVCGVRVSPCLQWLLVVLIDGGVWLVHSSTAGDWRAPQWIPVDSQQ